MVENYYFFKQDERIHIGKMSNGWRFLFNIKSIRKTSLEEIYNELCDKRIVNESGDHIHFHSFKNMIERTKKFKRTMNSKPHHIDIDGLDGWIGEDFPW